MADPTGFLQYQRVEIDHRPVEERIQDWQEVNISLDAKTLNQQAARCMDCGIPFCHGIGCPLANRIPEFNDLVFHDQWQRASDNLHSTNNFPEFTGKVCPAPCEAACTLSINDQPVNIKQIELQIVEKAFGQQWIKPFRSTARSGKKVAVVGSGPAGLAAAQQLCRAGHLVVVFEKSDRIGGLLRYGIPDFKLDKRLIDRRLEQMVSEGVIFEPCVTVGEDISTKELHSRFDATCLCMGAGQPRPLDVPGADLQGVHQAMEFLTQQNGRVAGNVISGEPILARGKNVVVIGGGDTGSDCVGTAIRQGARSVHQLEILPKPPGGHNPDTPWPNWPVILRTSTSHEEGCQRRWSVLTKELTGSNGKVTQLHGVEVGWVKNNGRWEMKERPGTEFALEADLVFLAMGFLHVVHTGLIEQLDMKLDARGNVITQQGMTSESGIFAAGDTQRGASLVVHAINEGRNVAAEVDRWLAR